MKSLVVYDSVHGNTEKIAQAIGNAIGGDVKVVRASNAPDNLGELDLLVMGAPTYGGRPTPAMLEYMDKVQASAVKGVRIAAFDTRLTSKFVTIFGNAATKIAASLTAKGGVQIAPPEGFFVKGREGPLVEGEPDRASKWARDLLEKCKAGTK